MQRMSMKLAVVALVLSSFQAGRALASDASKGHEERQQARLEQMRTRLGLSDEQVTQVQAIFASAREQAQSDRAAAGDDRQALRRLAHARRHDVQRRIEALLTTEQKARQAELRREHRAQVEQRQRHYDEAAAKPR